VADVTAGQRYLFAHRLLPEFFFAQPEDLWEALQRTDSPILSQLWGSLGRESSAGLSCTPVRREGIRLGLVTLPRPQDSPEAYFAALVYEPQPYRYLVLEHSFNGRTVLGEWNPRRNFGPGPGPQPEAFLESVLELLRNPPQMTSVQVSPEDFQLNEGDVARYLEATEAQPLQLPLSKLALCHGAFLQVGLRVWFGRIDAAAQASWWSFRFKKRVYHCVACLIMGLFNRAVLRRESNPPPALPMATYLFCEHQFSLGMPCLIWSADEPELTPEMAARFLAGHLRRPARARALQVILEEHNALIEERMSALKWD